MSIIDSAVKISLEILPWFAIGIQINSKQIKIDRVTTKETKMHKRVVRVQESDAS